MNTQAADYQLNAATINLLRHVLTMYANGKDDMGKEARRALRATAPKRKRKSSR